MSADMKPVALEIERCVAAATAAIGAETAETAAEASALRDLAYRVKKLKRAASRPQALGFFGPSQAGKSFLVGALLSHELGSLKVLSKGKALDFLREINPAKGVESTGVVTRFSTAPMPPLVKGDFLCKLLPLEVLLECLATGFLVECTSPSVDPERVANVLRDARLAGGAPARPFYREAWETVWQNLLKKYQDRHPYLNELRRQSALQGTFKDDIKTSEGWLHAYSLLWGGAGYAPDLDRLMSLLARGLDALGHAEAVEVRLEHVRASSDGVSLIDASCLNACGTNKSVVAVTLPADGVEASIEPGVLSALIAELHLPLAPAPGSLLDRADILDFPGGRALKGINGFGRDELCTGKLDNAVEVFKRGKLTFLFEQYALDREITALVLCSPGPTKPEAIQLQTQVEQWLKIRHGGPSPTSPAEVERPSLFLALTKFDMSLGALRSDNARDRWESRVQEACMDFWARSSTSWVNNWGARNKPFNNVFWIRNPYADQMQTLSPGDPDYEAIKAGYHESRAVLRHIRDHAAKWAAVEGQDDRGLQKSGVPLLAEALRAKLAEDVKAKELEAEAKTLVAELGALLRSMTPSRDETEERERVVATAKLLSEALAREMSRRVSGAPFGEMLSALTMPEDAIEDELRAAMAVAMPMSIKVSDKVKKVIVHVLKWWATKAGERFRTCELSIPQAAVDQFLREVVTSKKLMPLLGSALFPYFSRSSVDPALLAAIVRVTVGDAMARLFADEPRRKVEGPLRLSWSETRAAASGSEAGAIDWSNVDFEDGDAKPEGAVELVFAGSRAYKAWSSRLGDLYLENRGSAPRMAKDDPRALALTRVLGEVERIHVG